MFKNILISISCVFLISCGGSGGNNSSTDLQDKVVSIDIVAREHGYSNFNTLIIDNQASYNRFIDEITAQDNWNKKAEVLEVLQSAEIDFAQDNVILYRHTEGSGSIGVNPQLPEVNGDIASVEIVRTVPNGGTADMAYYAFAYKVSKDIKEIWFDDQRHNAMIKNNPGENIAPLNCQSWYDGCNECSRGADESIVCTKKFCTNYEDFNCKVWD